MLKTIVDFQNYRGYNLDISKINSIEDCAKILQFLCKLELQPTPIDATYYGFDEVEEYFE